MINFLINMETSDSIFALTILFAVFVFAVGKVIAIRDEKGRNNRGL